MTIIQIHLEVYGNLKEMSHQQLLEILMLLHLIHHLLNTNQVFLRESTAAGNS